MVLTIVDRFSRGVRVIPFPAIPTSLQTAHTLFEVAFRNFHLALLKTVILGPRSQEKGTHNYGSFISKGYLGLM